MGRMGRVRNSKKLELHSEIWGEWGVTYGENGSSEKFKKLELNSEIWGEWVLTYGENGSSGRLFSEDSHRHVGHCGRRQQKQK